MVVQQASSGLLLDTVENTITFNITDENRQRLMRDGVVIDIALNPPPGLGQVRVAVIDEKNGRVGSLRITPPQQ